MRQALAYAFDFEWSNKNLFYGQYERTDSFFSNSDLASSDLPSAEELKIARSAEGQDSRRGLHRGLYSRRPPTAPRPASATICASPPALLKEAGWEVKDGKLVNATASPSPSKSCSTSRSGSASPCPSCRTCSASASPPPCAPSIRRNTTTGSINFDYDMIVDVWGEIESPGNEQREFWGSAAADQPGSRQPDRHQDPGDRQPDRDSGRRARPRVAGRPRTHALDRVLLWSHYRHPPLASRHDRVAYWDKFGMPDGHSPPGLQFDAWWIDPAKAARVLPNLKN